jgi:hypothetical protein
MEAYMKFQVFMETVKAHAIEQVGAMSMDERSLRELAMIDRAL